MKTSPTRGRLVVGGLSVLLASGCGGSDEGANAKRFEGEEKAVAAVVDQLTDAARDSNGDRICNDLFATRLKESVAAAADRTCGDELSANVGSAKANFRVEDVDLGGDEAEATIVDEKQRRSQLRFERVERDWRITSIGALE